MTSRIPLPVQAGHRHIGSNNNNNSPSPPPFVQQHQHHPNPQQQHHQHYRNHHRNVSRQMPSSVVEQSVPPLSPSAQSFACKTRSPPKMEAFLMTGDLMINLASKQSTEDQSFRHTSQDPVIFRRKKQPQNIHSSSIQFGDESCNRLSYTVSLPSSPEQTVTSSAVVPNDMQASDQRLTRLSKSENQLLVCDDSVSKSSANGNRLVQSVADESQEVSDAIKRSNRSSASSESGVQKEVTLMPPISPSVEKESVQESDSELKNDSSVQQQQQSEINRTFSKKDIERLHAERNSSPPVPSTAISRPHNSFTDCLTSSCNESSQQEEEKGKAGNGFADQSVRNESHVINSKTLQTGTADICEPRRYPSFLSAGSPGPGSSPSSMQSSDRDEGEECSSPDPVKDGFGSDKQRSSSKSVVDIASATRLAKRLYDLQGFKKSDVSRHLSKNNEFGKAVAEEYVKLFNFSGDRLDSALRKFLSRFNLVGETQERSRVLEHFAKHYLSCNPLFFESPDAVHMLTCALLLLNNDLHGENVVQKMTFNEFTENLSRVKELENFPTDQLKAMYSSIKSQALPWAQDEEESNGMKGQSNLTSLLGLTDRSESRGGDQVNPFLGVTTGSASESRKGYVSRKCCYDPGGRKTPVGKRGWKMFYATLRDLVLYLHKDENGFRKNQLYDTLKNSIRIHHSLATPASDYVKKDFVFRLLTADQSEYLFKVSDARDMQHWMDAINFAAASLSAPPLAPAVGSQPKFQKPLLPVSHTKFGLREQFLDHEKRIAKLEQDLDLHLRSVPERSAHRRSLCEYTEKQLYLQYELKRYRIYSNLLKVRLQQSLGSQVLEKVLQKSLMAGNKGKPLTSYSIGEENDDVDEENSHH